MKNAPEFVKNVTLVIVFHATLVRLKFSYRSRSFQYHRSIKQPKSLEDSRCDQKKGGYLNSAPIRFSIPLIYRPKTPIDFCFGLPQNGLPITDQH